MSTVIKFSRQRRVCRFCHRHYVIRWMTETIPPRYVWACPWHTRRAFRFLDREPQF